MPTTGVPKSSSIRPGGGIAIPPELKPAGEGVCRLERSESSSVRPGGGIAIPPELKLAGEEIPPIAFCKKVRFKDDRSADADFDALLRPLWEQHLSTLQRDIAKTKGWRSHYWKQWLDGVVIDAGKRQFADTDVLIADMESAGKDVDTAWEVGSEIRAIGATQCADNAHIGATQCADNAQINGDNGPLMCGSVGAGCAASNLHYRTFDTHSIHRGTYTTAHCDAARGPTLPHLAPLYERMRALPLPNDNEGRECADDGTASRC